MKNIKIYPPSTRAQIKDINTYGNINSVVFRGSKEGLIVMYEIGYFFNNQYNCTYLYENQLNFDPEEEKVKIGFREVIKSDHDWQIEYCKKEIANMPDWKKEIYKQNFGENSYWANKEGEN